MSEQNPKPRIYTENDPKITRVIPALAVAIGLNESLILLQLDYWIHIANHYIDGKWWTYQSLTDMKEKAFDYMSIATISRAVKNLEDNGYIFVGNYNKRKGDRTRWFALNPEKLNELDGITINPPINQFSDCNTIFQNETPNFQNETTLPENTTKITTETKKNEDTDVSSIADATASVAAADFEPEIKPVKEKGIIQHILDRESENESAAAAIDLPFAWSSGYAYSPREKHTANGAFHIVVEEDIEIGRLVRKAHNALCQPPSKRFWGLSPTPDDEEPTCKKCLEIAERITSEPVTEEKTAPTHSLVIGIIADELAKNDGKILEQLDATPKKMLFGQAAAIWKRELSHVHNSDPIDVEDFQAFVNARRAKGWGFSSTKGQLQGQYASWLMNDHSIPEIQKKSQPPRQSQYGQHKGVYPPGVKIDIPEVRPTTHLTTDPETGKVRKEIFDGFITRRDGSRHPA